MRSALLALLVALLLGCESAAVKDDPVAPPPPPRISSSANGEADLGPTTGGVRLASKIEPAAAVEPVASNRPVRRTSLGAGASDLSDEALASQVVARADGEVIFARECLEPVRDQFEQAREQLPPESLKRLRQRIIRQQLPKVIERKLLAAEARRHLAEPQLKQVQQAADEAFQKKLRAVLEVRQTATEAELAARLRETGLSLEQLRARHREEFLGQQYARAKIADQTNLSRRDLVDYYQNHQEEFSRPPRVKWQHIEVSAAGFARRREAREKAEKLAALLDEGADFGLLARWHSEGPTAADDGRWDWTTQGSYRAPSVDHFLFHAKTGVVSPVLEGPDGYHLVKVLDREAEHIVPFEEVQDEIREKLRQQRLADAVETLVAELFEDAHLETIFDDDPEFRASLPHGSDRTTAKR